MKFNEKELAAWATSFIPDKEGLLEKRGAGISHGGLALATIYTVMLIIDSSFI